MPLEVLMLIVILLGVIAAVMAFQISLDDDDMTFRNGVPSHHTHAKAVTNALRVFDFVAAAVALGYAFCNLL